MRVDLYAEGFSHLLRALSSRNASVPKPTGPWARGSPHVVIFRPVQPTPKLTVEKRVFLVAYLQP